jgi:formylglycine-generating enzyme required for sulfatase activity
VLGITLLAALLNPAPVTPTLAEAPPGLVLVEGGSTKVGTTIKDAEAVLREFPGMAKPVAGETPQHTVKVEDFYLMPTEVTNEQYGEFVRVTSAKPPWTWGKEAVDGGRRAFLEEQGQLAKKAREEGRPFKRTQFEAEDWWDDHWRESTWEIPTDQLDRPVVYTDYRSAQAYARWTGLRLMTEFEFTRAARGSTDRIYTWGDDWNDEGCASTHAGLGNTPAAGEYPMGTVDGIVDLLGNVWEWTSSPYNKFKGYKPLQVKVGSGKAARTLEALAPFDSNMRVLVSGSFQQDRIGVRIATRMFAERMQSTNAVGLRCAASTALGLDAGTAVLNNDVMLNVLPPSIEFWPESTVILQRWVTTKGESNLQEKIPTYAVISRYERMLFVPVKDVPANSNKQLQDLTRTEGPQFLGFISVDLPLLELGLEPGTYHVAYRAAGPLEEMGAEAGDGEEDLLEEQTVPFFEATGFNPEEDQFFFYDLEGIPLVTLPAGDFRYERMTRTDTSVTLVPWEAPKRIDKDNPPTPMDTVSFLVKVAGKSGSKGFVFALPLRVEPDSIDSSWK